MAKGNVILTPRLLRMLIVAARSRGELRRDLRRFDLSLFPRPKILRGILNR